MPKKTGVIQAAFAALSAARNLSLRSLMGIVNQPRYYKTQFKTEKNPKYARPKAQSIEEGRLEIPFSAMDGQGILIKGAEVYLRNNRVPEEAHKIDKISAPAALGETLHERMVIESSTSIRPVDMPYPNLDCPDLYRKFSVVGVRDGNVHLLIQNSLGKTTKTILYGIFDRHGKLKAKGITMREQMKGTIAGEPQFNKLGIIELERMIGLNAHTLGTLEDAINKGVTQLRHMLYDQPSEEEAPATTLTMLEHIRTLLARHEDEKRVPFERRSGEDRRLKDERRDEPDRRTRENRRHDEEHNVVQLLDVQEREILSEEERRARYDRRAARNRRLKQERREFKERRAELHTVVSRQAYIWDKHKLLAHVTDHWSENCKYEADRVETNMRGDFPEVQLLFNGEEYVEIKGEGGQKKPLFVKPDDEETTIMRLSGKTVVRINKPVKGTFRLRPATKTEPELTIVVADECLDEVRVEEKSLGKKKIRCGALTVRVARGWKYLSIENEKGEALSLTPMKKKA